MIPRIHYLRGTKPSFIACGIEHQAHLPPVTTGNEKQVTCGRCRRYLRSDRTKVPEALR